MNSLTIFDDKDHFEHAQRVARALASSSMVPAPYQGEHGIPNVLVALEMANRIGMSPFMVMQNLNVIQGRPSWSSTFLIAAINSCGKFAPLKFTMEGEAKERSCTAWTTDKSNEVLEGPAVSMEMAEEEGWLNRNGSKWRTMPELMLRYRAAAFFSRLYCPEVTMGMQSEEEIFDSNIPIKVEADPANIKQLEVSSATRLQIPAPLPADALQPESLTGSEPAPHIPPSSETNPASQNNNSKNQEPASLQDSGKTKPQQNPKSRQGEMPPPSVSANGSDDIDFTDKLSVIKSVNRIDTIRQYNQWHRQHKKEIEQLNDKSVFEAIQLKETELLEKS